MAKVVRVLLKVVLIISIIETIWALATYRDLTGIFVDAETYRDTTAYIIIHHDAADKPVSVKAVQDYHKNVKGWESGFGYNFYLKNGKTILCRKEDAQKYQTLDDLNRPEVRVMINPGGLNEKFARENLPQATLIVYEKNEEIPSQVSEGKADVMITEITEAPYYIKTDPRLAAPLLNAPFTHGEIGVLMQKNKPELLAKVNAVILQMKQDGTLRQLHEKFGLVYGY